MVDLDTLAYAIPTLSKEAARCRSSRSLFLTRYVSYVEEANNRSAGTSGTVQIQSLKDCFDPEVLEIGLLAGSFRDADDKAIERDEDLSEEVLRCWLEPRVWTAEQVRLWELVRIVRGLKYSKLEWRYGEKWEESMRAFTESFVESSQ